MHPLGVFEFEEEVQLFPSPRPLFTLDSNLLILKRLHISTVQRYSLLQKRKLDGSHKNQCHGIDTSILQSWMRKSKLSRCRL